MPRKKILAGKNVLSPYRKFFFHFIFLSQNICLSENSVSNYFPPVAFAHFDEGEKKLYCNFSGRKFNLGTRKGGYLAER